MGLETYYVDKNGKKLYSVWSTTLDLWIFENLEYGDAMLYLTDHLYGYYLRSGTKTYSEIENMARKYLLEAEPREKFKIAAVITPEMVKKFGKGYKLNPKTGEWVEIKETGEPVKKSKSELLEAKKKKFRSYIEQIGTLELKLKAKNEKIEKIRQQILKLEGKK